MTAPPIKVAFDGIADKINHAQIGASGVSKIDSSAVKEASSAEAPCDRVTKAPAMTAPDKTNSGSSMDSGLIQIYAKVKTSKFDITDVSPAGVLGYL